MNRDDIAKTAKTYKQDIIGHKESFCRLVKTVNPFCRKLWGGFAVLQFILLHIISIPSLANDMGVPDLENKQETISVAESFYEGNVIEDAAPESDEGDTGEIEEAADDENTDGTCEDLSKNAEHIRECEGVRIGKETGLPLPRFVSLRGEANMRCGPGKRYRVKWIYKRRFYPIEVIEEFATWRKVRDIDGTEGWIHTNSISGFRTVVAMDNRMFSGADIVRKYDYQSIHGYTVMFRYPSEDSYPMMLVEYGAIGALKGCNGSWCTVQFEGKKNWVRKENLFGLYIGEVF